MNSLIRKSEYQIDLPKELYHSFIEKNLHLALIINDNIRSNSPLNLLTFAVEQGIMDYEF